MEASSPVRGGDAESATPGGAAAGEASPVGDVERPIWGMDTFSVNTKTAIRAIAVSSDGKYLAVGSDDPRVFLFEWVGGMRTSVGAVSLNLHSGGGVSALAGKWVEKGALRIRDGHVALLAFSGRGELLVGSDADMSDIFIFDHDAERGWVPAPRSRMDGGSAEVRRLRGAVFNVSPFFGPGSTTVKRAEGEEWLATWGRDKDEATRKVRLYQLDDSGRWVWRQSLDHGSEVHEVAFAPWGSALATAGADGNVRIWRIVDDTGRVGMGGRAGGWVEDATLSAGESSSAAASSADSPDAAADVTDPSAPGAGAAADDAADTPAAGGGGGSAPAGGGGAVRVTGVAFSPHGEVLVVGLSGKGARTPLRAYQLVHKTTGEALAAPSMTEPPTAPWSYAPLRNLQGPRGRMHALRFSPDGQWFMAASKDLRLWRVTGLVPAPGLGAAAAPGGPVAFDQGVKLAGFHEGAPAIFVPPTGVWIAAGVSPTAVKFWRILEAERRVAMAQVALDMMRVRNTQRFVRGFLARRRARRLLADRDRLAADDAARRAADEQAARQRADEEAARQSADAEEDARLRALALERARQEAQAREEAAARRKAQDEEEQALRKEQEERQAARQRAEEAEAAEAAARKAQEDALRLQQLQEEEARLRKAQEEEASLRKAQEEEASLRKAQEEERAAQALAEAQAQAQAEAEAQAEAARRAAVEEAARRKEEEEREAARRAQEAQLAAEEQARREAAAAAERAKRLQEEQEAARAAAAAAERAKQQQQQAAAAKVEQVAVAVATAPPAPPKSSPAPAPAAAKSQGCCTVA